MYFEIKEIYHIYNQGNNRQKIFFKRENYLFFIKKIKTHVSPYADILAWCLMPNHFHLMVYINEETAASGSAALGRRRDSSSGSLTLSRTPTYDSFNKSIGILLASYTRAINIQENRSGSLFRAKTKAICLTKSKGISPTFFNTDNGTKINLQIPEKDYPQICFNYIHNNPVKASFVTMPEDWEFSSYKELSGKEILINKKRIQEFELSISKPCQSFLLSETPANY
jgi:putative transposase